MDVCWEGDSLFFPDISDRRAGPTRGVLANTRVLLNIWSKGTLWSCEYFPRKVETLKPSSALAVPGWCLQQLNGISFNNLEFPGMLRGGWVMIDQPTPWQKSYSSLMVKWGVNGCFEHQTDSFSSPALAQFLASGQEGCFLRHLWWDPRSYTGRWVSQQKKLLAQIAGIVWYH